MNAYRYATLIALSTPALAIPAATQASTNISLPPACAPEGGER